jgi:hypothetical protein
MLTKYFQEETARVSARTFADIKTLTDWTTQRAAFREQLFEMAGLSPRPEKTDLKAEITARVEHAEKDSECWRMVSSGRRPRAWQRFG